MKGNEGKERRSSENEGGRKIFGKIYERENNDGTNANFIQWPVVASRLKRILATWKKLFHSKIGGGTGESHRIVIENGAVIDRSSALPPLCLRFTFAERRNFHPLSSDKSWGRWASDMENRCHERDDVSEVGQLDREPRSRCTCPRLDAVLNRSWGNYTSCFCRASFENYELVVSNSLPWLQANENNVVELFTRRYCTLDDYFLMS